MIYYLNGPSVSTELGLGTAAASATAALLGRACALHQISERVAAAATLLLLLAKTGRHFTLMLITTLLLLGLRHILFAAAAAAATAATAPGLMMTARLTRTLG